MEIAVVIPFRDRGGDPLRQANLNRVLEHWHGCGWEMIVADDGRDGDAQFNRSAAYNRGAAATGADMLIFAEADVLISLTQVLAAASAAAASPGLVIPFTTYRAMNEPDSVLVRSHEMGPTTAETLFTMNRGHSVGCINVISRGTLEAIGCWDESFEGSWYDDISMTRAFTITAGPTRFIEGPVHHLYHLPADQGDHLTAADRAATQANKARWLRYLAATTPMQIRELTGGG